MPTKPVLTPETLAELPFPMKGVDVSCEYERQPPGTTPRGTNVRAFEPATQSARGGARAGLSKFLAEQVSGAHRVQDLNTVVMTDPAVMGGVLDGGSGELLPGGTGDGSPGLGGFQPVPHLSRPPDDSVLFAKKRKKHNCFAGTVAGGSGTSYTVTLQGGGAVTATALGLAGTETVPVGMGVVLVKVGSSYFFEASTWR